MIEAIKAIRAKAELDMIYAKAKLDFADELIASFSTVEEVAVEAEDEVTEATSDFANI